MKRTIRLTIAVLGGAAAVMALNVQSVQALWFFTSDLVFVLLFPQLVFALFDRKVNLAGSVTAFAVSLVAAAGRGRAAVRPGSDHPLPGDRGRVLPIDPARWYDAGGALLFPYKTHGRAPGHGAAARSSRGSPRGGAPPRAAAERSGLTPPARRDVSFDHHLRGSRTSVAFAASSTARRVNRIGTYSTLFHASSRFA